MMTPLKFCLKATTKTIMLTVPGMLLLTVVVFAALAIKLFFAPINITPLWPRLAPLLFEQDVSLTFTQLQLGWNGRLTLVGRNIVYQEPQTEPIHIRQAEISLSNRGLLFGQLQPKEISASGLRLLLEIAPDYVQLGSHQFERGQTNTMSMTDVDLVALLNQQQLPGAFAHLHSIQLIQSELLLGDIKRQVIWQLQDTSGRITRENGFTAQLQGYLERSDQTESAPFRVDSAMPQADQLRVAATLDNMRLDLLRNYAAPELVRMLAGEGRAEFSVVVEAGGQIQPPRARLEWNETSLFIEPAYTYPLHFTDLSADLRFDRASNRLWIDQFTATDAEGISLYVAGRLERQNADQSFADIVLTTDAAPAHQIINYMPDRYLSFTKGWLLERISRGQIDKFTLQFVGGPENIQKFCGLDCGLTMQIDFSEGTIKPLDELPPIDVPAGQVILKQDKVFVLAPAADLGSGIGGRDVSITMDGLYRDVFGDFHMAANVQGPVQQSLKLIEDLAGADEPFPPITGDLAGSYTLSTPVGKDLDFEHTDLIANGTIRDLSFIPPDQPNMQLTGDLVRLNIADWQLKASMVDGKLNEDIMIDEFTVSENLQALNEKTRLDLVGAATSTTVNTYLAPISFAVSESVPVRLALQRHTPTAFSVNVSSDLTPLALDWGLLNWQKPADQKAELSVQMDVRPDRIAVNRFRLTGDDALNVSGEAQLNLGNFWQSRIDFPTVVIGEDNFALTYRDNRLSLTGERLDLRGQPWQHLGKGEGQATPKELEIAVDLAELAPTAEHWRDVKLNGELAAGELVELNGSARLANDTPLELSLVERTINLTSSNAGLLLRSAGFSNQIENGILTATLSLPQDGWYPAHGTVNVSDFQLRKVPILAELMASLSIQQLLSPERGILFDRLSAPFTLTEENFFTPGIEFDGPAMAMKIRGNYDREASELDLKGQLVPAVLVNKLISNVPLVGALLTGSQDGLVVADFDITGPANDPELSVNPFSVITPGLLKDMFRGGVSAPASAQPEEGNND